MFSMSLLRNCLSRVNVQRPLHIVRTLRNIQQTNEISKVEVRDITKDRTQIVPLETSLRYLKSEAYRRTYEDQPVWVPYRCRF